MCTYLNRTGSTYYFRRAVPAELRPFIRTSTGAPRAEWKITLNTKELHLAKRAVAHFTIATNDEIDAAKLRLEAAEHSRISPAEAVPRRSGTGAAMEDAQFEHMLWASAMASADMAASEARQEGRAHIVDRFDRVFKSGKSTAEMTQLDAAVYDIVRDAKFNLNLEWERKLSLLATQAEQRRGMSPPPAKETALATPSPSARLPEGITLSDLVAPWAAERKVQDKTRDAHVAAVRWFHDRVGEKLLTEITRQDVLDFKAKLIEEGTSLANTKVKISRIKALLGWASENGRISENVAAGIIIRDTEAAKNKRREFDLASLNLIFGTNIYTAGARPVRGKGDAAYWLPLLALHTGARLEELGQIRPADVQEIAYPDADGKERKGWFLRLREDESDNLRLKNATSERDVPVHPDLIRLGFLDFLKSIAGKPRLFPDLKADKYGRLTAKWGEWFGLHIRALGVADKRLVFHSFRHTFKQYARHAGIEEGMQRGIMGHSSGDVADQYGSGYPPHSLVSGMAKYRVPGLRLIERWRMCDS